MLLPLSHWVPVPILSSKTANNRSDSSRLEQAFPADRGIPYERSGQTQSLDEQRAKLLEDAKKEALEVAHKALADLNELGFDYRLVKGPSTSTARRPPRERTEAEASRRQTKDLPCPICEFRTEPHHDGRAHRSQETKRAFTEEELSEKGLATIA